MSRRILFWTAVFWAMLFLISEADDGVWQPLNQAYFVQNVQSIDIGYNGSQEYIYAAERDPGGKVWRSLDNFLWNDAQVPSNGRGINKIAVQKQNFQFAWALLEANDRFDNGAGPWLYNRTIDRWDQKINGLSDHFTLGSIAVHYETNSNFELLGGGGMETGRGAYLFKSVNNGDNWIDRTSGIPGIGLSLNSIQDMAIAPSDPTIAYFLLFTIYPAPYSYYRGIFRSLNSGDNWTRRSAVILQGEDSTQFSPTALDVDPTNPNRVLVGVSENLLLSERILESTDGGGTWNLFHDFTPDLGPGYTINSIKITAFDTYVAFYSNGQSEEQFVWAVYNGPLPLLTGAEQPGDKRAYTLAVDPGNFANIYIGTQHMIYRTLDFGLTVQPFVEGANLISNIPCIDATLPNIHLISNQPPFGSIYRSTDYGYDWSVRKPGGIGMGIFIHSDPGQAGL
jgi:hypothetical protein